VEVVVVRHLAETSSSSVREPLYEPGGTVQLGLGFLNCSTLTSLVLALLDQLVTSKSMPSKV
jgi:hypothetical protein